jgi:phosphoesterase RecJ-like protein
MIDHHQQPDTFAQVVFSDVTSCSTAQMIFQFIESRGDLALLDNQIGQGIYCGIMTDTGSFRFPSVDPQTHQIASWLIERGMNHAAIHRAVYDTNSIGRLKLLGYSLAEKLEVFADCHLAIISLTDDELKKFDYKSGDTEGFVNYALSIEGVNIAAFVREGNNGLRISFRSNGTFDVNEFARKHFSGGGHKNAAGGSFDGNVESTLAYLKNVIIEYKNQLDYE